MNIFRITVRQQLLMLSQTILTNIGFILIVIYYERITIGNPAASLPTLVVHFQYLIKNYECILAIDSESRVLEFDSRRLHLEYSFDEIVAFKYYRTYGKGSGWQAFGMYRYFKIEFKDGNYILITCLMINKIDT